MTNPTIIKKLRTITNFERLNNKEIKEVHELAKINFSIQNNKHLTYTITNLLTLQKKGMYVFNIDHYVKYLRVIDQHKPITDDNNLTIVDKDNNFLKEQITQKSYKNYSKVKYLEHHNSGKESLFLTLTCPSEYHYYTQTRGINKNCLFPTLGESIEQSFKFQRTINRELYKLLKKYLDRKDLKTDFDYLRMLEPHNNKFNLTIHSHSVFYLDKEQVEVFKHVYEVIVKRYKLKQTKLEILKETKSSSYVMKYILKNLDPQQQEDHFFNEFRHYYSNYRFFTCSKFKRTNQEEIDRVYTHLKSKRPKLFERFLRSDIPLYINLEKYILKHLSITYKKETVECLDYSKLVEEVEKLKQDHIYIDNMLCLANSYDFLDYSKQIFNYLIKQDLFPFIDPRYHTVKKIKKIEYRTPLKGLNPLVWEYIPLDKRETTQNIFKLRGFSNV